MGKNVFFYEFLNSSYNSYQIIPIPFLYAHKIMNVTLFPSHGWVCKMCTVKMTVIMRGPSYGHTMKSGKYLILSVRECFRWKLFSTHPIAATGVIDHPPRIRIRGQGYIKDNLTMTIFIYHKISRKWKNPHEDCIFLPKVIKYFFYPYINLSFAKIWSL